MVTDWEAIQDEVRAVAKDVARKWPDVVTADDVEQDVMVLLLESPGTLNTVLNASPKIRKQMYFKLGHQEASKQHVDYEHWSGQFCYHVEDIRKFLEDGALTADSGIPESEVLSDLIEALAEMTHKTSSSNYVDSILVRYVDGVVPDKNSADRKRLNRAVTAVTERMNRIGEARLRAWSEGPGTRPVMTNARSHAETANSTGFDTFDGLSGKRS